MSHAIPKDLQGASWKALFYKLAILALPIALQNLVSYSLQLVDTIMVGQLNEVAISAVTAAGQTFFIFSVTVFGFASGATVLCSQYWGKGDRHMAANVTGLGLKIVLVFSVVTVTAMELFPTAVCSVFSSDPQVVALAASFLRVIAGSYLFAGITTIITSILRIAQRAFLCLLFSTVAICINTGLNYCLILGHFGFAPEGVLGAARATFIARVVETALIVGLFIHQNKKEFKFTLKDIFEANKFLHRQFARYCLPVVINECAWSLGISMQIACLGHISARVLAAYSITSTLERISLIFTLGVATATAIIVGQEVGANRPNAARFYTYRLLASSVFIGMCFTGILLVVFPHAMGLFKVGADTKSLAFQFLIVICFTSIIRNFNCPAIVGVLRGSGDTKAAALLDILPLWCLSLPLVALAVFVLHLPPVFVFVLFFADELTKWIPITMRLHSGKWIKNLTTHNEPVPHEANLEVPQL